MLIVVTGVSGHVGTNLCMALRAEGERVRAVDIREQVGRSATAPSGSAT